MPLFGTSLFTFYWQLLVPAALMFYPMPKRKGFIWRLIICLAVTIAVSLCYYSPFCIGITNPVIAHFIFFATAYSFCIIIVHVCFQLPFTKGLFFLFETFVIQNVCYHLFSFIMQLAGVPIGDEYSTFLYLLFIGALYALVYLTFFSIVEKRHLRHAVSIPKAALLVEAFFFFIDMFVGVYFRYGSDMLLTDTLAASMYRILSLAVGFLIISLCLGLFNIGELTDNNKEMAKRIEFESRYYEISKNYAEEIRKVRHDLKHQINAIRTVQDDETREGILKELEEGIKRYGLVMKTGNTALDSVLLEKNVRCNNLGLSLNIMADGSLLKGMTYNDIYVLFGNALDNAIESSSSSNNETNNHINVEVIQRGGMAYVHFDNWCDPSVIIDGTIPKTSKTEPGHGYGLRSILFLVDKYGGSATVNAKDGLFALDILLPINN